MWRVRRHDRHAARAEDLLLAVDGERNLALDDVPHLFLLVPVLVQGRRVGHNVVVSERHVLRVKEATGPAW